MQTPEYWSEKIYRECPCHVMGRSAVKPEVVAQIQADARAELLAALEEIEANGSGALNNAFPEDAPEIVESLTARARRALANNKVSRCGGNEAAPADQSPKL
jgi:hypothetical protein